MDRTPGHRKIIHVDMDAFYASVEQRDNPSLVGQPLVVGGDPESRGVVAAASYEARKFGILSAMPMKTAFRLCPHLLRVSADFGKYHAVSKRLHEIFDDYTDLIEPVALDEAYLDVTYNKMDIPFGSRVARMIKSQIRKELALTASAGVGPNKFLAKLASDHDKPDGFVVVMPDQVADFLSNLAVSKIPGVGRVTADHLESMQIATVGELATRSPAELSARFGKRGTQLWRLANGIDEDPVTPEREPKQLSQETTFATDLHELQEMRVVIHGLADELSGRLSRRQLTGRVVTLKVRYPDFQTQTRSQTLTGPTDDGVVLFERGCELLGRTEAEKQGVRLLGLGLAGFEPEGCGQLDLFSS